MIHHELAIAATAILLFAVTWGQPNQAAPLTFLLLFVLRLSAKFNLYLGVPNLSDEVFPEHLAYLKSYFRKARCNALFPFSILLGSGLDRLGLDRGAVGAGRQRRGGERACCSPGSPRSAWSSICSWSCRCATRRCGAGPPQSSTRAGKSRHHRRASGEDRMNYEAFFEAELAALKDDGRYRIFAELERKAGAFPAAPSSSSTRAPAR